MPEIYPFSAVRCSNNDSFAVFTQNPLDNNPELDPNIKSFDSNVVDPFSFYRVQYPNHFVKEEISGLPALHSYLEGELLIRDKNPSIYIYKQIHNHIEFCGIISLVSVEALLEGKVKKHEQTRVDKEKALAENFAKNRCNGNPVLLTYPDNSEIEALITGLSSGKPDYNFLSEDGLQHQIYKIYDESSLVKICSLFGKIDSFYIADGHHRCASYSFLKEEVSGFMSYLIPAHQLRINSFHRLLKKLSNLSPEELISKIFSKFEIRQLSTIVLPPAEGFIHLIVNNECYEIVVGSSYKTTGDVSQRLDVAILEKEILGDIIGIKNTRTDQNILFMNDNDNIDQVKALLFKKEVEVAFLLHPISPERIFEISDANEIMPPKSTFIEPKLRSGILIHQF